MANKHQKRLWRARSARYYAKKKAQKEQKGQSGRSEPGTLSEVLEHIEDVQLGLEPDVHGILTRKIDWTDSGKPMTRVAERQQARMKRIAPKTPRIARGPGELGPCGEGCQCDQEGARTCWYGPGNGADQGKALQEQHDREGSRERVFTVPRWSEPGVHIVDMPVPEYGVEDEEADEAIDVLEQLKAELAETGSVGDHLRWLVSKIKSRT